MKTSSFRRAMIEFASRRIFLTIQEDIEKLVGKSTLKILDFKFRISDA